MMKYIRTPPINLSKRLYMPYTKAELVVSLPMTSEISEVAVFSMMDKPTPCKMNKGYIAQLTFGSSLRKYYGSDDAVMTMIATTIVRNRCPRHSVSRLWRNIAHISLMIF
jgi:hypothetical protein